MTGMQKNMKPYSRATRNSPEPIIMSTMRQSVTTAAFSNTTGYYHGA